ncbi:MAG TPA: beta-ketoacyl synthase N-terminal-like domain-containing protein [Candidatus Acidoferrales bacterium]|nr:beta-ketoacyl synthase N-terminal-like domain-containing protein [Candidatus Acidoferrales bacterium]
MQPVYIAGAGLTKFGKSDSTLTGLLCEAANKALAGSPPESVDAVFIGAMNPEEFTGSGNTACETVEALGLTGIPALRLETASSAGAAALHAAFHAIASGYYRRVLVLGGEKMTHLSTSAVTRILAEVIDKEERVCGATMPALAAMITESYRKKYRLSRSRLQSMLCKIALKNHLNGSYNPNAQFRTPISERDYFASKWVATPLRLYDCSPITDGAAGLVLTAEKTDLIISGIGQATGPQGLCQRHTFTSFPATQVAARRAYAMAGIGPKEIDFAEVHDAFTIFEIMSTEDLGFFAPGKGGEAALAGKTALDGELPINPSGGLKSRGHPVGASGLAQVVEAVNRLRGESKPKLKRTPVRALTQSTGGLGANNFVTIIERAEAPRPAAAPRPAPLPISLTPGRRQPPVASAAEGRLETFTVLHVTPDGFLAPLALGVVRTPKGQLVFAQGEDIEHLKIGREVYLRRVGDHYCFTVKSQLQKVTEAFKKLLSRVAARSKRKPLPAEAKR